MSRSRFSELKRTNVDLPPDTFKVPDSLKPQDEKKKDEK